MKTYFQRSRLTKLDIYLLNYLHYRKSSLYYFAIVHQEFSNSLLILYLSDATHFSIVISSSYTLIY